MKRHMVTVMIPAFFGNGGRSRMRSGGSSVASASEAKESMIMLTQSSWIAVSGDLEMTAAPTTASVIAQMLTQSWN